jgi:acyl-CoA hydrolase
LTQTVTPEEAAALLQPGDSLGIPLGTGQPGALLEALGERDDWDGLRIYGALLFVFSPVFEHPGVHYLSGFYGPVERMLRDKGANISFSPADFRRFEPLLAEQKPRVMAAAAATPFDDGWVSLSLHAGASIGEMERAGADPNRVLMLEVSERFPKTLGLSPDHRHALHLDQVDVLIESDHQPFALEDPPPSEADRKIAEHASRFIPEGATLQTGIGAVPSRIAGLLAERDGGDYGIHSEMFTTGLMQLHRAGKVSNLRKGVFPGFSVTTFAAGTAELYTWLDGNTDVRFLPVDVVNSPHTIASNHNVVTINGALAVDLWGQAAADALNARQYSGIGGHEDFVAVSGYQLEDRSLLCLPSVATIRGDQVSRIGVHLPPGATVTTPRHQVDVVITEFGIAELRGRTVRERGRALAAIAHPDFRDELREAAEQLG